MVFEDPSLGRGQYVIKERKAASDALNRPIALARLTRRSWFDLRRVLRVDVGASGAGSFSALLMILDASCAVEP